jgi:WD40 repeat protein
MDVNSREFLKPLTLGWESPTVTKKADDDGPKGSAASVAQAAADRNAFPPEDPNRSPQRLVACLACSSRDIVATGDLAGQVRLWDLASGKLVDKMPCTEEKKVQTVRFSPDGRWLAYYVEGVLHVVDVAKVGEKPKDK